MAGNFSLLIRTNAVIDRNLLCLLRISLHLLTRTLTFVAVHTFGSPCSSGCCIFWISGFRNHRDCTWRRRPTQVTDSRSHIGLSVITTAVRTTSTVTFPRICYSLPPRRRHLLLPLIGLDHHQESSSSSSDHSRCRLHHIIIRLPVH
jgi:hypothetical protein